IVNDFKDGVYYGRLIISAENEIEGKNIIEIDARSSDCIALAIQSKSPIYVAKLVMEESEDVSDIFSKIESGNIFPQEDTEQ
ncbi:MAG: bifunctional nuclease domain-containing protein, partial [Verrucomicrobiales bacterium]